MYSVMRGVFNTLQFLVFFFLFQRGVAFEPDLDDWVRHKHVMIGREFPPQFRWRKCYGQRGWGESRLVSIAERAGRRLGAGAGGQPGAKGIAFQGSHGY